MDSLTRIGFGVFVVDQPYADAIARHASTAAYGVWFNAVRAEVERERAIAEIRALFPQQDATYVYDMVVRMAELTFRTWDEAFWHVKKILFESATTEPDTTKRNARIRGMIDEFNRTAAASPHIAGSPVIRIPHFAITRAAGSRQPISGDGIVTAYRY